jgi:hypothetical protein
MIEILQTPSIAEFRRTPSRNRGRGVEPMRLGTIRLGVPPLHAANSLFRGTDSLFGQKEFPAFGGAGNWLQAVESAWRPAPKPRKEAGIVPNIQKFPVNFPVLWEFGCSTPRASRAGSLLLNILAAQH